MSRTITNNNNYKLALNTTAVSSNGVVNGNAIDISQIDGTGAEINLLLITGALSAGTIALQDIQFSNDNTFASGVVVADASYIEHYIKGDTSSSVDAITQTLISTANTLKKIGLHIPFGVGYKYARARFIAAGTPTLSASAIVEMTQGRMPVNQ